MQLRRSSNSNRREAAVRGSPAQHAGASVLRARPSCGLTGSAPGPDPPGGLPTAPSPYCNQPCGLRAVRGSVAHPPLPAPVSAALQIPLRSALPAAAAPIRCALHPLWLRRFHCLHWLSTILPLQFQPPLLRCPPPKRGFPPPPAVCERLAILSGADC